MWRRLLGAHIVHLNLSASPLRRAGVHVIDSTDVTNGFSAPPPMLERYSISSAIAAGGMATIHLGRMLGPGGFSRTVAIKRLHPHYAADPDFVAMLLDEGRMAARISHPNVVATLDVVRTPSELFLVMEYVPGVSLARLLWECGQQKTRIPIEIAVAIGVAVLHGLHAAHEARDDRGTLLELVHRDVSPQNVLLAPDGVPRVVDFGIAKAVGRSQTTREGVLKGKIPYMAPEQFQAGTIDRRVDLWSTGVVLWEMLLGERPFQGEDIQVIGQVLYGVPLSDAQRSREIPQALMRVLLQSLRRSREERYGTAREMATELEHAVRPATASEVGAWVERAAGHELAKLVHTVAQLGSDAAIAATAGAAVVPTERIVSPPGVTPGDISSLGAVSSTKPTQPAKRSWIWPAIALSSLVALFPVAWLMRPTVDVLPAVLPVSEGPKMSIAADGSPAVSAPEIKPPGPVPASSVSHEGVAVAPAPKASTAPSARSGPKKTGARPTSKNPPPPPGDEHCYSIDDKGIWQIKPECL